jgi:hypothetical protein
MRLKKGYEEDLADYEMKPFADKKLAAYRDWHGYDAQLGKHINKNAIRNRVIRPLRTL